MRRESLLGVSAVLVLVGCAAQVPAQRPPEKLYLAIEVTERGKTVASPKLLGFEGHRITAERHTPGTAETDFRLVLRPEEAGAGYRVLLDLETPLGRHQGKLGLLHGEERRLALDAQTELRVMLMRVDSPEFRALLTPRPGGLRGSM